MADRYPESPLFYRRLDRAFPRAVRGEGAWIVGADGRRWLDAAGGAFVVNVGHGVGEIATAVGEQAARLAYVNGTQFTNDAAEALAAELAPILPAPLRFSYFLTSGSEAVEAAVKLARQVWVERGRPGKWKVVSRVPSYHGNTLAALSLSGRESYRRFFAPLLLDLPRIPGPDPYRHPGCPACSGEALEAEILRQGPETVAAFLCEPIPGSSAGVVVPEREHYERVADTCRRHDVLLIADEVLTGIGRTGRWFAGEHFDLRPDVLVCGKGLSGGYAPLSALCVGPELAEVLARGSGALAHAQTFSHTPLICSAGVATLRHLKRHRLVERCAATAPRLAAELAALRASPLVGDVRSIGLLGAVELVRDRDTRAPFARAARVAERVTAAAFERGLVVWPGTGHVDGADGDLVLVAPPFTIAEEEIAELGARLGDALAAVAAETA